MGAMISYLSAVIESVQDAPWIGIAALVLLLWVIRLLAGRRAPACRPGEVWFAMVPFEDGTGAKDRPVLVLRAGRRTCTVAHLTSRDRSSRRDFLAVPDGVPGLARASWISRRETTLPRAALRRRIGDPGEAFLSWYRRSREAAGAG
ncbi:type II toxin-antitoxin system PemK/MazF family toxin [Actinotalea sp.]|uniref:type II toxin-antitoxin system PemK/MazF family toxin n=1 Tax=Actinotalea sp. TaxID=1872145 RepID=UPI00356AD642